MIFLRRGRRKAGRERCPWMVENVRWLYVRLRYRRMIRIKTDLVMKLMVVIKLGVGVEDFDICLDSKEEVSATAY